MIADHVMSLVQTTSASRKLAIDYLKVHRRVDVPMHIEDITAIPRTKAHCERIRCHNLLNSSILQLPRELRDIILAFMVEDAPPPLDARRSHLPAMLSVCRQIRDEFAQIFYARKLIMAGGAPSPRYEKRFFDGFDTSHKKYLRRVHWLWDSYGTKDQAVLRAADLDGLSGLRKGTWTVGYIDGFVGRAASYVNAFGTVLVAGSV